MGQDESAEPDDITEWMTDFSTALRALEKHADGKSVVPPYDRVWLQQRLVSEPWDVSELQEVVREALEGPADA